MYGLKHAERWPHFFAAEMAGLVNIAIPWSWVEIDTNNHRSTGEKFARIYRPGESLSLVGRLGIYHIKIYPKGPCMIYYTPIYIWLIVRVNVGKYTIHGSYAIVYHPNKKRNKYHVIYKYIYIYT